MPLVVAWDRMYPLGWVRGHMNRKITDLALGANGAGRAFSGLLVCSTSPASKILTPAYQSHLRQRGGNVVGEGVTWVAPNQSFGDQLAMHFNISITPGFC